MASFSSSEVRTYPILLVPSKIESINSQRPPLPRPPQTPQYSNLLPAKPQPPTRPVDPSPPTEPIKPKNLSTKDFYFEIASFVLSAILFSSGVILWGVLLGVFTILIGLIRVEVNKASREKYYKDKKKYESDVEEYHNVKLPQHKLKLQRWEISRQEYLQNEETILRGWEETCEKKKLEARRDYESRMEAYQQRCEELHSPSNLDVWRAHQRRQIVKFELEDSGAKVGSCDDYLLKVLQQWFPQLIFYSRQGVESPFINFPYTPDVTIQDRETGIAIDVEVDESHYIENGVKHPIHFLGKDDRRNEYFKEELNWYVLRFSEYQVCHHADSCAKEVAKVLDSCLEEGRYLHRFGHIQDVRTVPHWSEEEALSIPRCRCSN